MSSNTLNDTLLDMFFSTKTPGLAVATRLSCLGLLTFALHAEYTLKNGTILQDSSVKQSGESFTATILINGAPQPINFTANDLRQVNLPQPAALNEAKLLIAAGKPDESIEPLQKTQSEQAVIKGVPGAYWTEATELLIDALILGKKNAEAEALVREPQLSGLLPVDRQYIKDYFSIFAGRDAAIDTQVQNLRDFAKSASSGRLSARAWLEIGNALSEKGRVEEAIQAWLRVTVFHQAEEDLCFRAMIATSRAMQQINRHDDGKNLLKQYEKDQVVSPYVDLVKTELLKFVDKQNEANKDKNVPNAEKSN